MAQCMAPTAQGAAPRSPACAAPTNSRRHPTRRHVVTRAQQSGNSGITQLLRQIQGAMPIIGLVSRLTSVSGGVGRDELQYTEYSRSVFEAAPEGFQFAVADLQERYGAVAQRRYILLALWMARQGAGLLPGKSIVDGARRLRVSQDIEFEMDRFNSNFEVELARYNYMDRPRGGPAVRAEVAVDALARLCCGLKDGEPLTPEDGKLIEDVVVGGFFDQEGEGFREEVRRAVAERDLRAAAYVE